MPGRVLAALIGITLCGAALRFATLDLQSFWIDEAVTARLVSKSFGGMLSEIRVTEATPPLYYALVWLWAKIFGTGEVGLRSLSALVGTLFIPVSYAAAATLTSRRVGVLVAALAATSPFLVWYSQEARAYMLMVLFSGISLLFFGRALREPTRASLAAWSITSAVAMATHYFAVFVVIAEAAALLALSRPRRRTVVATIPIAAVGLALVPLMREQSLNPTWIADLPLRFRVEQIVRYLTTPAPLPRWAGAGNAALESHDLWWLGLAILTVASVLVLYLSPAAIRRGALIALGVGSATIVMPLVLGTAAELIKDRGDFLLARNVLAAWLPLTIVVAAGWGAPRLGAAGIGAVVTLCVAGGATVVATGARDEWKRDDWRRVVSHVPAAAPVVIAIPPFQTYPLEYYDPSLIDANDGGSLVSDLVVVRPAGEDLRTISVPASLRVAATERVGRWEIVTLRSRSPVFVPAQPGRRVRSGTR